jgi:hypothetical protein
MKKMSILLIGLFLLTSCASIDHKTNVNQRLDTPLTAGIGDAVYRSTTEKNLPNAFGKADIFGRTTPTASTTIVFEGIRDGVAIFSRKTTDINTGATTMNSTPIVINNSQTRTTTGSIGNTPIYAQTNVQGPSTILPPNTPTARFMERNTNLITIDSKKLPSNIAVEGMLIRVLEVDSGSVRYIITRQN